MKEWFMLQMWRINQIVPLATLSLMMLTYATTLYNSFMWRNSSPYLVIPLIVVVLVVGVLTIGYIWDTRLKMQNAQAEVGYKKTPFALDRFTPQGIFGYITTQIPYSMMKDPESASMMVNIVIKNLKDPYTLCQVKTIMKDGGCTNPDDYLRRHGYI